METGRTPRLSVARVFSPVGPPFPASVQRPARGGDMERGTLRARFVPVVALLLTGCAGVFSSGAQVPPDVVHPDAHNGGSALAFNPDGNLLASGGWEGRVQLWSLPGGGRHGS